MADPRELTELEHCVLGALWAEGRRTAYAVRKEFASSVTSYWSASAGTIYPVISRLERLGLLEGTANPGDARGKREFRVTAKGRRELERWVANMPAGVGRPSMDPIRTRVNFLDVLPEVKAKRQFVVEAIAHTEAEIPALEATVRKAKADAATVRYLKALSCLYELQARLRWLRIAKQTFSR